MGLRQRYRDWRVRRKGVQVVVQVGGDGFIPALQFTSDNLEKLLEASSWAYACVTMNAEAVATLPGIVQRRGKDGEDEWIRDRSHELNGFVSDPFANTPGAGQWSWQQLIETAAMQVMLAGNSYWRKAMVRTQPQALFPFRDPLQVEPLPNEYGFPGEYRIGNLTHPAESVVHVMNASPSNLLRGQSPMKTALRTVELDRIAAERQKYNLQNRVQPGLIVKFKGYFGATAKQRTEVEKLLNDKYRSVSRDGSPLIIGDAMEVIPAPDVSHQINHFDARRFAREEVLAIFHTPPPLVGDYQNATLQNFDKAFEIWWTQALFPMAGTIYGAINRQFVAPHWGNDVRLWYDVTGSPIGLKILGQQIDIADKLVKIGFPTNAASARVGLGMPRYDELDRCNTHLALAGRGEAEAAASEPEAHSVIGASES